MSDSAAAATPAGKISGWFKALIGTFAGLMSGACMMYLSPLVDKVIKPSRPVANFSVEHRGLAVTFHNSSTGGDGWWDFGDGSALEPASHKQPAVSHTYAQPGTYTVKLTLRNLLNDENERTVTVNVDGAGTVTGPPAIVSLDAIPMCPTCTAPATFRLTARTKNAELLIWECGDDQPLQIVGDTNGDSDQDRYVTFNEPGGYVIKLAAVKGKQAVEKSTIVSVGHAAPGMLTALLKVGENATKRERSERPFLVTEAFTAARGEAQPINRQIVARHGYEITSARFEVVGGQGGKDLRVQVASDRRSAQLVGQLVKPSTGLMGGNRTHPPLTVRVTLTEEKRCAVSRAAIPMSTTLAVPGTAMMALPPCPCDWGGVQRQLRLELRHGDHIIWPESQLPQNAVLTHLNRRWSVTATVVGDQVKIEVLEVSPGGNVKGTARPPEAIRSELRTAAESDPLDG